MERIACVSKGAEFSLRCSAGFDELSLNGFRSLLAVTTP